MLDVIFQNPFNTSSLKKYTEQVNKINSLEKNFKNSISNGTACSNYTCEAFAIVREATKRVLNIRHFDVQLIGGLVLNEGKIAKMKTGEGKTFVAMLPVYLNALCGKGVQVIT